MNPLDPVEDAVLREIYSQITSNPYAVLRTATTRCKDRLAAAEAKHEAARVILEDFDEHGEANRILYGGHRRPYFEKMIRTLEAEIAERRRHGEESDVYQRYRKAYDERMSRAAQEFLDGMDAEERLSRTLANDMVRANNAPSPILEALGKLAKIPSVSPPTSDTIQGVVHNALRDCAVRSDFTSGGQIVLAYAKVSRLIVPGPHYPALVGSAAIVARDPESRRALWEVLVSDPPKEPRLAYNLACQAAVAGDRDRLLKYGRFAVDLGKKKEQFAADPDFSKYWKDPEFLALFERPRIAPEG
jgi:hypothetical protein